MSGECKFFFDKQQGLEREKRFRIVVYFVDTSLSLLSKINGSILIF